ncbi:zinc ABC transporter substrate-binding protein [Candidatus Thiothrix anitrata]|uniref:High-affinity zinc uptake system protein ZnuA n=1 Tax=Candidatus Thiothrix anitrata TaxID=2823902 RepID=A0ABX7X7N6_9GAMM|nr:zinc ABC transporter substrate-binding protein [Candidatus Thiothrix anitrata]QTR51343.1 zinc ABC transporter substrate-binding protein [Candidatus Thiothrix anitrata]
MLRILTVFLLLCVPVLQSCQQETDGKPLVISTIKPVQALLYAVAGGDQGAIRLHQLLPDGASPHHYALKPSDQRLLEQASAVLYIGEGLESFLGKSLSNLPPNTQRVALAQTQGIQHLYARHHTEHAGHEEGKDWHIWLNPANAIAMTQQIAQVLSEVDPANRARYHNNAAQLIQQINATDSRIKTQLAAVKTRPYLAFHDAWQHFDTHYALKFAGAVTLDISRLPGARHVQDIRRIITEQQAACLFQEPQFPPALVKTLTEGTNLRIGELDPLGMKIPLNADTYPALLQSAADSFTQCLSQ